MVSGFVFNHFQKAFNSISYNLALLKRPLSSVVLVRDSLWSHVQIKQQQQQQKNTTNSLANTYQTHP